MYTVHPNEVQIRFYFLNQVTEYKRYPATLVSSLSKIGGLLALFKVGFLLQTLHQRWFEDSLIKRYSKKYPLHTGTNE